jgi:hypothetical protein
MFATRQIITGRDPVSKCFCQSECGRARELNAIAPEVKTVPSQVKTAEGRITTFHRGGG